MIKRSDFPILKSKIGGRSLVYFDNAATSQKPQVVINAVTTYYENFNANVHRGLNPLAAEATARYEAARDIVAGFIGAKRQEVIFTRGATESINLVARTWGEANLHSGDIVLLSVAEHHANIVPWLQLKGKIGLRLSYIPLNRSGELDLVAGAKLLKQPRVKLISVSLASNVLGLRNDPGKLLRAAKKLNIISLIDAAQAAAHEALDVKKLGGDFLAFSGHKIYGPTGTGVLYGREELLAALPPFLGGGDMIDSVALDGFSVNELPYKFEAGTPNIAGVIGLGEACKYLKNIGWSAIKTREESLRDYFLKKLETRPFIRLVGSGQKKLPLFSLIIDGVHPHDAADLLGQEGIILRAGHHCAEPLHRQLGLAATLRASLSFYNTKAEIDYFFKKLDELYQAFQV